MRRKSSRSWPLPGSGAVISRRLLGKAAAVSVFGKGGTPPRPLNAPDARQASGGVQPGQSPGVVFARRVIVFGSDDGVYVYSGTPRAGNPPIEWISPGTSDPYGNTLPAQGIGSQLAGNSWATLNGGNLNFARIGQPLSLSGGIFAALAGQLDIDCPKVSASDTVALLELISAQQSGVGAQFNFQNGAILSSNGTPANPTAISTDGWNAVSNPAGVPGTIRVQLSPLASMAVLDVNATITSDLNAPTSYVTGNLPSAAYYPAAARMYPVSVNQQWSTTANASPRLLIPTSGGVSLQMPGFNAAGNACIVSATILYPLN